MLERDHPLRRRAELQRASFEAAGFDIDEEIAKAPPHVRAMLERGALLGDDGPQNGRSFPGTAGNALTIGDVAAIDITGTALTVAAWINPTTVAVNPQSIIGKDIGTVGTGTQYYLYLASTRPTFLIGDAAGGDSVSGPLSTAAVNTWLHVAGRKNGSGAGALSVLSNGVATSAASSRSIQNTAEPLRIGARSGNDTPFSGIIAEVAIWNAALTDDEVMALAKGISPAMIRRQNLRGFWPLWGNNMPEVDLSGNGNNATALGTGAAAAAHAPVGPLHLSPG